MGKRGRAVEDAVPHEFRTIDTIGQVRAAAVQAPDQWHSVRDEEVEATGQFPESWLVPTHRDDLCVREINRPRAVGSRQLLAFRSEVCVSRRDQRSPEDIDRFHAARNHPQELRLVKRCVALTRGWLYPCRSS